jgi:hypothetical protein
MRGVVRHSKSAARLPVWVIRVAPTGSKAAPNVRYAESVRRNEPTRCAITGREQSQQDPRLFNHLVGEREQLIRHSKPEHLGGLAVEHELEFG